jgi:hypothetical protein
MRKTPLRRLEALEKEERSRQRRQRSSLETISFLCRKIVLGYYVGGLQPDEDPGEAEARALNYESRDDYLQALFDGEKLEISNRFKEAYRRLFAQVGLNFDRSPPSALSKSFVRMVNQLPEQWVKWLRSELRACHTSIGNGAGSNLRLCFSGGSLFLCGRPAAVRLVLRDDKAFA